MPGPIQTTFPTVRRAITESPGARTFLEALGYSPPDVVAEVLDKLLPSYRGMDVQDLEPEQHDTDIEHIIQALALATSDRRQHLREQLQETAFVIGENANDGLQRLMKPEQLYERTDDLQMYFNGNPDAWFLSSRYIPRIGLFRGLGSASASTSTRVQPTTWGTRYSLMTGGGTSGASTASTRKQRSTDLSSRSAIRTTTGRSSSGTRCSRRTSACSPALSKHQPARNSATRPRSRRLHLLHGLPAYLISQPATPG
jgi:hypothetical protein